MNRRRFIKAALAASVAPVALPRPKEQAMAREFHSATYRSGWYVEAPVHTTVYVARNRGAFDALLRRNPRLTGWCMIPVGSQYRIEEPCESSLAKVRTASVDYRVDAALAQKSRRRTPVTMRRRHAMTPSSGGCSAFFPPARLRDLISSGEEGFEPPRPVSQSNGLANRPSGPPPQDPRKQAV